MSVGKDITRRAVIRRRVAAPRERVFRAWTEPEQLQRWFFPTITVEAVPHAEVDLRVGGRYRLTMQAPDGRIMAMVGGIFHAVQPPEKLAFSWAWEAPDPDLSETLVTVELHEIQGETEILIIHEHFPGPAGREKRTIGWICCLNRLVQLVEAPSSHPVSALHGDPCRL